MNLDFKIGYQHSRSFDESEPKYARNYFWGALASIAVPALTSLIGSNKQAKAVKEANATNDARLAKQDQSAWNAYLFSRGVNPGGAATGTLPTTAEAVNFKLPLYARAAFTKPGATKTWRKKGTTVAPGTLTRTPSTFSPANTAVNPFVMPQQRYASVPL